MTITGKRPGAGRMTTAAERIAAAATGLPAPASTPAGATLVEAGRLMGRHEVSHLVVTDDSGHRALGVVSALDVVRHIAFGRADR